MDFGIARLLSADATLTRVGGLVGTLDFIAPEQIQAGEAVDGRVDVYALGVTAFQLLTGVLPFRRTNPGAMVMAHLLEPAPDPLLFNPDLPERVGWAIRRALAKAPGDRYPTAGAFVGALEG
jgi:serine/threonine protein kinase